MAPKRRAHQVRAQFNVAIRTVVVDTHTGQAKYGTGGGIVWDSDPVGEYEECLLKARVLTVHRPVFELLESLLWTPEEGYFLLKRHLARMRDSAEYFDYPFDEENIRTRLMEQAPQHPAPHKTRLLLDKAGQVILEQQPLPASSSRILRLRKASAQDAALKVTLAPSPISSSDIFLYHKTTHRAVYKQARADCPEFDEVLLWNEKGEVTEFTASNVVVERSGELFTPPVECGLLPGTFRGELLGKGVVIERVIRVDELSEAEAVWAVNSVRGWQAVDVNLFSPSHPGTRPHSIAPSTRK
jgi:para-aminobenzoate synthetase/4-amino-4-deoxychorismate lyase